MMNTLSTTPTTCSWPPFPNPRCEHAAVLVGQNKVFVVGGYGSNGRLCTTSVLDLATQAWSDGPKHHDDDTKSRRGLTTVVCGNKVYAIGGYCGRAAVESNCTSHVDWFEFTAATQNEGTTFSDWEPCTGLKLGTPRSHAAAVAIYNRFLVVLGGHISKNGSYTASVEVLDTVHNVCVEGPCMNVKRAFFGAAVVGNHVLVVGGKGGGASHCVESIGFHADAATATASNLLSCGTWTMRHDLNLLEKRVGHAIVSIQPSPLSPSYATGGGGFIAVGGRNERGTCLSSAEWVDLEKRSVEHIPASLIEGRSCFAAVQVPPLMRAIRLLDGGRVQLPQPSAAGGVMVLGGKANGGWNLASVEILPLPATLAAQCLCKPPQPPLFPNLPEETQTKFSIHRSQLCSSLERWLRKAAQVVDHYKARATEWILFSEGVRDSGAEAIQEQVDGLQQLIQSLNTAKDLYHNQCTEQIQVGKNEVEAWTRERQVEIHHVQQTLQMLRGEEVGTSGAAPYLPPARRVETLTNEPPGGLCCPLTLDLMRDPVMAMDGHTYERCAIQFYWDRLPSNQPPKSPKTNLPLPSQTLIPNHALRSLCEEWRQQNHS